MFGQRNAGEDRGQKAELPARFIGAPIQVVYDRPPALEKRPGPPDGFTWQGRTYRVAAVLREWHDYRQRGKTKTFYIKERGSYRAKAAERRGSWGVGRDYYRVRTEAGELFDLYYDRSPGGAGGRKGSWFLFRQVFEEKARGEGSVRREEEA
jgi:stalled ribosome alternative rescue factor ArfA